jgi:hypothetical protein
MRVTAMRGTPGAVMVGKGFLVLRQIGAFRGLCERNAFERVLQHVDANWLYCAIISRKSESTMHTSKVSDLVRNYFSAYESKDRNILENLLSDDFTFSSPRDDRISRTKYVPLNAIFAPTNSIR